MNLDSLRTEIDQIDDEVLRLFLQRMKIISNIAKYKIENDLPVFSETREGEILARIQGDCPQESKNDALVLFQTFMDISKSRQHLEIAVGNTKSVLRRTVEASLMEKKRMTSKPNLVCQGVEGAYSHIAATKLFDDAQISFARDFESVLKAVDAGLFQFGVLPLENSSAGSVLEVYDLLKKYNLSICKSIKLPISHCLLAKKGVELSQISEVFSHQQAINQCSDFLKVNPQILVHSYINTASAARLVSEIQDDVCTTAAIASRECAEIYNLNILKEELENAEYNHTRFICVSKELYLTDDADKISISLTTPHEPGALYRLLTRFAVNRLNLTKLESRPLSGTDFEFLFYFDFEGNVRQENVLDLLCALSDELEHFQFIGNYKEILIG